MKSMVTVLLLAAALPMFAADPPNPGEIKDKATMCYTPQYALCIKAPCEKTPDASGNVRCSCIVENGWNMGPNSCDDRLKNLTSTYSNKFNGGSRVLTCPQPIDWAWCYGAPCEKDPNHPRGTTAICKCPVLHANAAILVSQGKCADPNKICSEMWSAAYPKESEFANTHFATWMKDHGHKTLPPAEACPTSK